MKNYRSITLDMQTGKILHEDSYDYTGPVSLCKGDSTAKQSEQQQAAFNQTLRQSFATRFATQNDILSKLNGVFSGIVANPQGFTPTTLAALNTNNLENSATDYQNATKAAQASAAAHGGNGLPSGVQAQIAGQLASAGANETAQGQRQIALANADQQQRNFWAALSGETGIANTEDPLGYASGATSGSGAVAGLSKAYTDSKGPGWGSILGGIAGGVASSFLKPIGGELGNDVTGHM